jgi:phosphoglucosamine mutase
MEVYPQVLVNVPGVDRLGLRGNRPIAEAVARAEHELGSNGRVLLRPSGTEALVRVMVEAPSEQQAREVADRLAAVVGGAAGSVGTGS